MGASTIAATPSADLTALSTELLEAEVVGLAGRIAAASAQLLGLIAELDRRSAWGTWGCRSMAHWLSWHAGIDIGAAREQVRTARALEVLALTAERFGRGELSYSKVRALTRIATPGTEADLIEIAATATASQLERFVQAYRRSLVAEEAAERAIERRRLSWSWDDDGSLRVSARLPPEDGAQFLAGLASAAAALSSATIGTDHGQRHADALVAMAEGFLAAPPTTRTGGDRTQIVLHIEPEALADPALDPACDPAGSSPASSSPAGSSCAPDVGVGVAAPTGPARAYLEDGPGLAWSTVRRLCCDAGVVPIVERSDGSVLDIGRRTRTVPRALRRALARRDEGCRFPGCNHTRWVDAHHVVHWADGGATKLENLCLLCRFHHRLVHEGGYRIELRPDGTIQVCHPAGWLLEPSPPVPVPAGMPLPAVARQDALRATWAGERFDLDLAVSSTRWAQLREGALPPVLPPGVSAATSCHPPVP
ncbi:MAG TPA: DUF222 domain-containing protein [Ilumatobacteraceae bacterium]